MLVPEAKWHFWIFDFIVLLLQYESSSRFFCAYLHGRRYEFLIVKRWTESNFFECEHF